MPEVCSMTAEQIHKAALLWRIGNSTYTIAEILRLAESEVARQLPAIKRLAADHSSRDT